MLDEPGCARIRVARDPGGNQARQAGLDDTEHEMAMTAWNAKVHSEPLQRKGRASAGTKQAEPEHPADCPGQIKLLRDVRGVLSRGGQEIASRKALDEGRLARAEHGECSIFAASEDNQASRTCCKIDFVGRRARLRGLPDQIERPRRFDQRRARW